MEGKLNGSIAVVTGAGKGIGRAVTSLFLKEGATVFGAARTESDLLSLADETAGFNGKLVPVAGDITDRDFVERFFAKVENDAGRLDILINNAGFAASGSIFNMDPEKFLYGLKVNIWSVFLCTQLGIRIMKKNNYGKIINLGSVRSHWTEGGSAGAYNASKYGLKGFTESVAREIHGSGLDISIGMVCPGVTDTPLTNPSGEPRPNYVKAVTIAKAVLFAVTNPGNVNVFDITLFSTAQKPW